MKRINAHLFHLFLAIFITTSFIACAASPDVEPAKSILVNFLRFLNTLVLILTAFAFVVFGWGIIKLIFAGGDAKGVAEAKKILLYGVIGIFVLVSLGGILFFIKTYIGIPDNSPVEIPKFQ